MSNSQNNSKPGSKPWDGVFSSSVNPVLESFSASVATDSVLAKDDIRASRAHAEMLCAVGAISKEDLDAINAGFTKILEEIDSGNFAWKTQLEDVHMNIEARLTELCGEAGKRLHTARSRNDQVATDTRLYLRQRLFAIAAAITDLQAALLALAQEHTETIMPGYTHFQPAQPIVFAHHLMAWYEALDRDWQRLADQLPRLNTLPLGSAALAGTGFDIDREQVAHTLGFTGLCNNSLDGVSDRDFAIEFCAGGAISMMHLSRMAEEIIIWVNPAVGFVELPDSWCTGSSIMPQKKNPDALELIRGKTSHSYGALVSLLTLMKAQPLAYNRDMQEDKPPLLNCARQWLDCLQVMTGLIKEVEAKPEQMRQALSASYATATDLADYLVGKGVAFRDAHRLTGEIVRYALTEKIELDQIPIEKLRQHCDKIGDDVYQCLSLEGSVAARGHRGGTAPSVVRQAIAQAKSWIEERKLQTR